MAKRRNQATVHGSGLVGLPGTARRVNSGKGGPNQINKGMPQRAGGPVSGSVRIGGEAPIGGQGLPGTRTAG